jgi:CubicO group peptidase (beta-lactamase class C family)
VNETTIHGHCEDKFLPVQDAFAKNFADGLELGASFALAVDGKMVVDLWGGSASLDGAKPWLENTIVTVASTSKVPCTLCGLMLIDRGLIDLDEPVATYWPEFAAGGKETLPVRYLFSHSAGLAFVEGLEGLIPLSNWDDVVSRLAGQKPMWEPGTRSGYHASTYGFLIGELVRRTTGKSLVQFFREEVTGPLDADFLMGVPEDEYFRVAEIQFPSTQRENKNKSSISYKAIAPFIQDFWPHGNERWFLEANFPGSNGVGNARSISKIGSVLAEGGTSQGHCFLGPETASLPYQEQVYGKDLVMGDPVRWGVGFGMTSKEVPLPYPNAFHWGGFGGSGVIIAPERRASWSYAPNKFAAGSRVDERSTNLTVATIKCLESN